MEPASVELAPSRPGWLQLRSPFMAAAGCLGYVAEGAGSVDLSLFGAAVTRGTSVTARPGAPPPRMVEAAAGVIWSLGHHNPGIDHVIERLAPRWARLGVPVVLNLWAASAAEASALAERADGVPGVAALELDLSAHDARRASALMAAARDKTEMPILAKVSVVGYHLPDVARALEDGGADAITCGSGLPASAGQGPIDEPALGDRDGAMLSGPAIRPVVMRAVAELAGRITVPIIGCGGVTDLSDALAYLAAGARAVQVGTAMLAEPNLPARLALEYHAHLSRQAVGRSAPPGVGDF
ncbi:MAG: nitronate monooxygenase [Chloroflexi bacterium]|nr:nitronate monooxygenase [Chloroflexota bacterium]